MPFRKILYCSRSRNVPQEMALHGFLLALCPCPSRDMRPWRAKGLRKEVQTLTERHANRSIEPSRLYECMSNVWNAFLLYPENNLSTDHSYLSHKPVAHLLLGTQRGPSEVMARADTWRDLSRYPSRGLLSKESKGNIKQPESDIETSVSTATISSAYTCNIYIYI